MIMNLREKLRGKKDIHCTCPNQDRLQINKTITFWQTQHTGKYTLSNYIESRGIAEEKGIVIALVQTKKGHR